MQKELSPIASAAFFAEMVYCTKPGNFVLTRIVNFTPQGKKKWG